MFRSSLAVLLLSALPLYAGDVAAPSAAGAAAPSAATAGGAGGDTDSAQKQADQKADQIAAEQAENKAQEAQTKAADASFAALETCVKGSGQHTLDAAMKLCEPQKDQALKDAIAASGRHPQEMNERELMDAEYLDDWTPVLAPLLK